MGIKCVTEIGMQTINCGECGSSYAINQRYYEQKQAKGGYWNCPYCRCSWGFKVGTDFTEKERLEKELASKNRELERQTARAREIARQRDRATGAYKKIRNRVKNGVCPCCNRTFQNLMEHMKTQHADFGDHELLLSLRQAFGMTQADLAREAGVHQTQVSRFENSRSVPDSVKERIADWMTSNA